jgi:hypothetical protein
VSKTIRNTHISGEAGVIKFAEYCNQHVPYILFREVVKNDFGIDGEVELTRTNEERKIEPTGEIIKVQIKTVGSDNSYIRNEKDSQFEFHARKEDIEYWDKYRKNGIEVIIIIYDQRNDSLYCKKVFDADVYIAKESLKKNRKKNLNSILFDKSENILTTGESGFTQKYSNSFKGRISFDLKENLQSNFMKLKLHPKQVYQYKSKYKTKKAIFENIKSEEAPYFIVYGEYIYTFIELGSEYKVFKEKVISTDEKHFIPYSEIVESNVLKNHYVELLNEHLRSFLWNKKIVYSKDYKRYYFKFLPDESEVTVEFRTRKRNQFSEKSVVKRFDYNKLSFYRHLAVEFKYLFVDADLFIILNPKYLFTEDGRQTLEPKKITKLTNFLTSREYNNHYCDWLHFWWNFLSKGKDEITIYEDPVYKNITGPQTPKFHSKHPRILLSYYYQFEVDFGIPIDKKERKKKQNMPDISSSNLLF